MTALQRQLSYSPSRLACAMLFGAMLVTLPASANSTAIADSAKRLAPMLAKDYLYLHQHPELSFKEQNTAAYIAKRLTQLGFSVQTNVGGHGVVGLLMNGQGKTVMLRSDTDALPVTEQTGKDYASTVRVTNDDGLDVGVMHACGHDIHMTSLLGAAESLVTLKKQWQGTLMVVFQPAEERGAGAKAMLADGLFSKHTPDAAIALHVSADLPAGTVAVKPGYTLASVDSVDITVKGVGGHGAYPHKTIDPIVIAARLVLALQTITAREVSPLEPSVVTVGSIHGGSKHNVIGNDVKLQLTLRSYNPEVRDQQIAAIKRIANGIAMSAGLGEENWPEVKVSDIDSIPSTYNEPKLAADVEQALRSELGPKHVKAAEQVMGGEDFGLYGRTEQQIPITIFWLGAVAQDTFKKAQAEHSTLPSLHSSKFIPDYPVAIDTGVRSLSAAALAQFQKK